MRKSLPTWLFWLFVAVSILALAASAILLVDYVKPAPVFCGEGGGCGAMKRTVFAYPFGIPMPVFGLSGILAIALAGLVPGRRARIAQAVVAVFAGLVAIGLLGVQASMDTFCPYCIVVDVSSVVLAALSVARAVGAWDPPSNRKAVFGAVGAVAVGIAAPLAFGLTRKPLPADLPAPIAEEIRKAPRGKVTIVDFADFECPFCRMTHTELAPILAEKKDKIHLVRKQVPLRMHPHAKDAARAACCGESMGKGDEMADALFSAPTEELTPEGCEKIAQAHGLDVEKFRACVGSKETEERIEADGRTWRAVHGHGLPTLWFGTQKLEGAQDQATMRAALDEAIKEL
ncbi:hypothetical protein AKJ09_01294 [Labilithrix luteola]|uniref:Thioredoxin domain-containing protein n=1 Tax=Labilithrix luteola TaxID=1391654 RepID=A0A0K1PM76_9BACT|nr:thioredoxin domain-containing protein [Labilithrix luteola]AKU94630.1 hypothetical protein AKJ09_01294 [Labilithrix luteola]